MRRDALLRWSRHTFAWPWGPPPRSDSATRRTATATNEDHRTYFEAMNVALGSVSVVASTRPEVANGFAPCQSVLDLPIVRALTLQGATSLCTVATAAAPENGAGYAV